VDRFFLNPWALAFAALAGGIVLLYILKLKRIKVEISSTLLWERVVTDFKANAPWQRLRRNILMILQIIALILLAIALARPFIFGTALMGGRTVALIDTSASMLTRDGSPDRLGDAIDAAAQLVDDLSRGDEGMVIAAGPSPRILQSFTSDKGALREALSKVRKGAGGPADLDVALGLVSSVATGTRTRVVIFSDGAVPDISAASVSDEQGRSALNIDYYPVGSTSDNLAIINAGARQNPFSDEYELFVALHNYYPLTQEVDVTLSVENDILDVRTVELEPCQRREVVLVSLPYIPDPIRVEIDFSDPLAEDNVAFIVMPEQVRYKVALAATGESLLLRQVLRSLGRIDLYNYEGGSLDGEASESDIDVWVVEGDTPSLVDPTASYLFIDTLNHAFLPVVPGTKAVLDFTADPPVVPTIVGLERAHPLLRFVGIADTRIQAMRRCQVQPWGRVVVDASEGPLLVEGNLEGQRTVYFALDIYESDFPLRAAFPIFMANAINYLGQASRGALGQGAQAGTRIDIVAPIESISVTVTDPGGAEYAIDTSTREFTLASTTQVGIYHLEYFDSAGEPVGILNLPVSLINDDESNLTPAANIRVAGTGDAVTGSAEEIAGRREVRVNREFYTWLILGVLLILSIEWYLYHTRAL
jgi:hypothetical protein